MRFTPLLIFMGAGISGVALYVVTQNVILTLLTFSLLVLLGALQLDNEAKDNEDLSGFKFKKEDKVDNTKNVILWDRSTVDLPSISYLQKQSSRQYIFALQQANNLICLSFYQLLA